MFFLSSYRIDQQLIHTHTHTDVILNKRLKEAIATIKKAKIALILYKA